MSATAEYQAFLARKREALRPGAMGIQVGRERLNPMLFEFQKDCVTWALRRGRAAIFADCVSGDTIVYGPLGGARIDTLALRGSPVIPLQGLSQVICIPVIENEV